MKVKVLVIGSTGMLGCGVADAFRADPGFDVTYTYRDVNAFELLGVSNGLKYDCTNGDSLDNILNQSKFEYVINCIGVIKPFINSDIEKSIFINSVFPHKLARVCQERNIKMFHITTDCVYTGKTGRYTERDDHDEQDIYGRSKSLGEPSNCMVLRTSIIGEEKHKKASLVEWAKSMKGKSVNGFTNHFWNGITTQQYGDSCIKIIKNDLYKTGKFHIFSPSQVSKYELLNLLNDKFVLDLDIKRTEAPTKVDRTLATIEELQGKLQIPELRVQLAFA